MPHKLNRIIGGDEAAKYTEFFRETKVQISGL
jgi:hypothetical protein